MAAPDNCRSTRSRGAISSRQHIRSSNTGPAGAEGSVGTQGSIGPQGPAGDRGPAGPAGPTPTTGRALHWTRADGSFVGYYLSGGPYSNVTAAFIPSPDVIFSVGTGGSIETAEYSLTLGFEFENADCTGRIYSFIDPERPLAKQQSVVLDGLVYKPGPASTVSRQSWRVPRRDSAANVMR
ncbi:MAG: collagen-like protein [Deltaproteobacteria bacterium]|nr:collagen-like protein [Deltaproteobacteria bacterium]